MARKGQIVKMVELVAIYLNEQVGVAFNEHTTRRVVLLTFARWWDAREPFYPAQSLDKRMIQLWFAEHRKKNGDPIAPITRRNYASFLREFVRWGVGAHEFDVECIGFKPGKVSSKASKPKLWLNEGFLRTVWEAEHPYFRGLLAFTAMTLARGNEVTGLRLGDLNQDLTRVNLIRTKVSDFDDQLPIVEDLRDELELYLTWYENLTGGLRRDSYLFPRFTNNFGKRDQVFPDQQRYGLWEPCKRLIVKHGLGTEFTEQQAIGIGGHTLRRSMAKELHKRLVELGYSNAMQIVQAMLGHTDIRMTQAYIGMADGRDSRDEAMDKFTWKRPGEVVPFPVTAVPDWDENEDLDRALVLA